MKNMARCCKLKIRLRVFVRNACKVLLERDSIRIRMPLTLKSSSRKLQGGFHKKKYVINLRTVAKRKTFPRITRRTSLLSSNSNNSSSQQKPLKSGRLLNKNSKCFQT